MQDNKQFSRLLYNMKGVIDFEIEDYEKILENPNQSYHDDYVDDLIKAMSEFLHKYYKIQNENSV